MSMDGINDVLKNLDAYFQAHKTKRQEGIQNIKEDPFIITKRPKPNATKQVTPQDLEQALNEPRPSKAMKLLLAKSPLDLEGSDFTKMGYQWAGTAYHIGAPTWYESGDGGRITVYSGRGTKEMGEDVRKTVYEKGNYKQEMFYDENGKLTRCSITIIDPVTGKPERKLDRFIDENGRECYVE